MFSWCPRILEAVVAATIPDGCSLTKGIVATNAVANELDECTLSMSDSHPIASNLNKLGISPQLSLRARMSDILVQPQEESRNSLDSTDRQPRREERPFDSERWQNGYVGKPASQGRRLGERVRTLRRASWRSRDLFLSPVERVAGTRSKRFADLVKICGMELRP